MNRREFVGAVVASLVCSKMVVAETITGFVALDKAIKDKSLTEGYNNFVRFSEADKLNKWTYEILKNPRCLAVITKNYKYSRVEKSDGMWILAKSRNDGSERFLRAY